MKILKLVSKHRMIAEILKGEINSSRSGHPIKTILTRAQLPETIITNPDLTNSNQNLIRTLILEAHRGYLTQTELFNQFPQDVTWYLAHLDYSQLDQIRYLNWHEWNRLTDHTRSVIDGANNISKHQTTCELNNQLFYDISELLKTNPDQIPLPIIVGEQIHQQFYTILEGHARFTAYALLRDQPPTQTIPLILGLSPHITQWKLY